MSIFGLIAARSVERVIIFSAVLNDKPASEAAIVWIRDDELPASGYKSAIDWDTGFHA
jgi:hypothetical protein